jgi:DNA-binding transcriptional ArsR family regulator
LPTKADTLLHPIRMRIIQCIARNNRATASDLRQQLPDIPPATLYRHLGILVRGGFVLVVDQRQVRGAVEKIYAVEPERAVVSEEDLTNASRDDYLRYARAFAGGLLADFSRYFGQEHFDMRADGAGFHVYAMNFTDEENMAWLQELGALIHRGMASPEAPGRQRRLLYLATMPGQSELKTQESGDHDRD